MIRKILIANRGEIACRIIRTCRKMGIATVAVYSDSDAQALHVHMADEAIHIGANPASESYLNIDRILDAATQTHSHAIHPGYGFLAENAQFAQRVIDNDLIFIGPDASTIEAMGDKRQAKLLLKDIPYIPGYIGDDQSIQRLVQESENIGFPIMIKASAGGGGKGMRKVNNPEHLEEAIRAAKRESSSAFGNDTLILEKFLENPRHIEVQIIGDQHGNLRTLGERECTIQRRHQKVIEEAPSPSLSGDMRDQIQHTALQIGQQLGYQNAGTVEFLLDNENNFYFIEMNTRLQVEHAVTEAIFDIDLVRCQIMIAEGYVLEEILPYDHYPTGHAIEARVYAENPEKGFLPDAGDILLWDVQDAHQICRIDSGVQTDHTVSADYDPLIAKVIAHGSDRSEAIRKLAYALGRITLFGIPTNIQFLRNVLYHVDFIENNVSTNFIPNHPELTELSAEVPAEVLITCAVSNLGINRRWRNNANSPIQYSFKDIATDSVYEICTNPKFGTSSSTVKLDEQTYQVEITHTPPHKYWITINERRQPVIMLKNGEEFWIQCHSRTYHLRLLTPFQTIDAPDSEENLLNAPMTGKVIGIMVKRGQFVQTGATLLLLEAMKMEHQIKAPYDGVVEAVHCVEGDTVKQNTQLIKINRSDPIDITTSKS